MEHIASPLYPMLEFYELLPDEFPYRILSDREPDNLPRRMIDDK
jgi:hypothetical protein